MLQIYRPTVGQLFWSKLPQETLLLFRLTLLSLFAADVEINNNDRPSVCQEKKL